MSENYKDLILNIPEWLEDEGVEFRETSSGVLQLENCPSCGKSKKCYVNPDNGLAICHSASCDMHGGVSPFDLVMTVTGCTKKEAYELCFGKDDTGPKSIWEIEEMEEKRVRIKKEKETPPTIELPYGAEKIDAARHTEAWSYLINRGYSKEIIEKLNAYVLPYKDFSHGWRELTKENKTKDEIVSTLKYVNRIIFPLYIEGEIKGFIARDYAGTANKGYKALNSEGAFRSFYFWNYDNVKESEVIVITEGITDAMKCGIDRSIAILGSAMTDKQIELLETTKAKKIILALDVGTEKVKQDIYEKLMLHYMGEIYEIYFEPLFISSQTISDDIILALEEYSGENTIKRVSDNSIVLEHFQYDEIKKRLKSKWFKLSEEQYTEAQAFFDEGSYKDAGDFSVEEMEQKIQDATLYVEKSDFEL